MSPDAPGFPRVELGTARPWRTPIGDFAGTLSAGRLPQTPWAPQEREGARSGSFFEGRWRPMSSPRIELGAARFYNRDWQGVRFDDLIAPFGSLFFDAQTFGGGAADNQLIAVYGAVRVPEVGLELWTEFGKNDRSSDVRDLAVELEHNSAWLFGVRREWRDAAERRWVMDATAASAKIPPIVAFRGQSTFYEHNPISQGHTNRGQLLGTRLLERTGGLEVRVDRHDKASRLGLIIATRDLPQVRVPLDVPEDKLRREWSVLGEWQRTTARGHDYFIRTGLIADLNRHPTFGDAYSAVLATGVTLRP